MKSILVDNKRVVKIKKEKTRSRAALRYALKRDGYRLGKRHWWVTWGRNWYKVYYYDPYYVPEILRFLEFMEGRALPLGDYLT